MGRSGSCGRNASPSPSDPSRAAGRRVWNRVLAANLVAVVDLLLHDNAPFDALVADRRLRYTSPNTLRKRGILGATMLSMLAGRYVHIPTLRVDGAPPEFLGMIRIISEDAVRARRPRRSMKKKDGVLRRHLDYCVTPLLNKARILDFVQRRNRSDLMDEFFLPQPRRLKAR
jgi:hypothetical protein